MTKHYQMDDLLYLMKRLRDPVDGCPWDRKQSFTSIASYTVEEAYEVAEAIAREDMQHLKEELGDLLFQTVFYSQLGVEQNHFDFNDVVDHIVKKLVRRHPHVFPNGDLYSRADATQPISEPQIKANWEAIKQQEREEKGETRDGLLDSISDALAALRVAEKLQKKAASVGFDWQQIEDVFKKTEEELQELRDEVFPGPTSEPARSAIEHELGDLLFCCVNLARFLSLDPEQALRKANLRFRERFAYIESTLKAQGASLESANVATLDALWNEAKKSVESSTTNNAKRK